MAVPSRRAGFHGGKAAHATILFVAFAAEFHDFAGRLGTPANNPPQITAAASVRDLTRSPDLVMPPSAMTATRFFWAARDATYSAVSWGMPTPATMRVVQMNWTLPDLDGVGAALGQELDARCAGHIARNDRQGGESLAQHFHSVSHTAAVAMGGRDGHHVQTAFNQSADMGQDSLPVQFAESVAGGGDRRAADQAEMGVAGGLELGIASRA